MTPVGFVGLAPSLGWGKGTHGGRVDMDAKKALMVTATAFLVLSLWHNPTGTANAFSDFLGNVGGFLEDAIDKFTEFFRSLTA
jgi:hypothetical protein